MRSLNPSDSETERLNTSPDALTRKYVPIITWIIVLFIPSFSKVTTYSSYGPIKETTYFLPWMVLIHLQPPLDYQTDQYTVISFPWSLLIFIPFIYALKLSWEISKNSEERIVKSSIIVFLALLQIGLLAMTFNSQDSRVNEDRSVFYTPQIILMVLHGFLAAKWFFEETQANLKNAKIRKESDKQDVKDIK